MMLRGYMNHNNFYTNIIFVAPIKRFCLIMRDEFKLIVFYSNASQISGNEVDGNVDNNSPILSYKVRNIFLFEI